MKHLTLVLLAVLTTAACAKPADTAPTAPVATPTPAPTPRQYSALYRAPNGYEIDLRSDDTPSTNFGCLAHGTGWNISDLPIGHDVLTMGRADVTECPQPREHEADTDFFLVDATALEGCFSVDITGEGAWTLFCEVAE